jgi:mono/diheme cytochrome c family protein
MKKIIFIFLFGAFGTTYSIAQKATKQSIEKGKIVFEQYCLACHQADGSGVPHLNPPLIKTSFVLGDKKKLIGIILNGLSDVEVEGESYSNPMPGFSFLTDDEVANVLTYVRNSFTNKASAVTPVEVKTVR